MGYHCLLQEIFPGIEPVSLTSPTLAGRLFSPSATWEALTVIRSKSGFAVAAGLHTGEKQPSSKPQEILQQMKESPKRNKLQPLGPVPTAP